MEARNFSGIKAVCTTFILLALAASSLSAKEVGRFSYRSAPENLDGDTILVNDTMVAMSEKIRVFQELIIDRPDTIPETPAVFFLIDNSSSMNSMVVDPKGNRFTVASALIDTTMARFPQAEVGVAVFSTGLYFNPEHKPGIFQTVMSDSSMGLDDTGAFVPLLTLNQTYGIQTGYEILKEVLAVSNGALTYPSILMNQSATNINSGFDAALQAFAASTVTKSNQFIIFLSDGEANRPPENVSTFVAATNCPTTYTVFFTPMDTIPPTIQTFTSNCQTNGYSPSNPNSNAWPFLNTTAKELMDFLMQNIFSLINTSQRVDPASIVINGQANTSPWSSADSTFLFSSLFPLQSLTTPFSYVITKGNTDTTISKIINFWVKTQQGTPLSRTSFNALKWDRDLIFRDSGGMEITIGTENMDEIGLYFTFARIDTFYTYTNVSIELSNVLSPVDKETVVLTKGTSSFSGKFSRAVSDQPSQGNGILETHAENDSIIAIFRNSETPRLPLDTLRIAIPYQKEPAGILLDGTTGRTQSRQIVLGSYRINLNIPTEEPFTLRISDVKGSLVKQVTVRNPNTVLPSNLLPEKSGLYIITATTDRKQESKRVLIMR